MRYLSSVKKTLRVLDSFSLKQPELGVTEISHMLSSNKASIYRILMTLMSEGFVEKNHLNNKYRLGLKIVELARRSLHRYDLRKQATPFMERLAQETGEISHLSILDKNEIVHLEKIGEGQILTVATKIGERTPAHSSSMGKVLLAGISLDELDELIKIAPLTRLTPNTITKISKLKRELEKVRSQGFAIDNEETYEGIKGVGAPIKDDKEKVIAAICITAPTQRMGKERIKEITGLVIETARLISEKINLSKF